ncbi:MAG: hypothetical protein ACFCUE_01690 [Candidatus Bathyarchaeia archaeon]
MRAFLVENQAISLLIFSSLVISRVFYRVFLMPKFFKGDALLLFYSLEREKCLKRTEWVMLVPDCILLFSAVIAFLLL